ncbi:hypothetical protein [Desulfovibrio gilichinskyi]|uniref:Uncharacterized protein n=1 Tax=Desulfovibrio gilichinskyi TaxID=1519643 RepID=A0A1X7CV14_9BACT|nr:hypothetical protein [Desulfovibrio gilichinskyi]SMF03702.1 hypothetical protein SAMN06295933_1304 [Desulfovibrio gilichinskyi]
MKGLDEKTRLIKYEHELTLWRQGKADQLAQHRIMHNALMQAGFNATKAILIVSGGSFVAMLAFIGQILVQNKILGPDISKALTCLGTSAILALLNSGIAYLIYVFYTLDMYDNCPPKSKKHKWGTFFEYLAMIIWLLSFTFLIIGGYFSLSSILGKAPEFCFIWPF